MIASCRAGTELESVVSHCGIVVPPGDQKALGRAIATLADDAFARVELGRQARAWAIGNAERDTILGQVFSSLNGASASRVQSEFTDADRSHAASRTASDDGTEDEFVPTSRWAAARARGRSRRSSRARA